jgi:hypothetical protein
VATRRSTIFIATLASVAIFAAATLAAATPRTPPPGATVRTSHPDFTWTLPSNEESLTIYIADKPDVTPAGKFDYENFVDGANLLPVAREWSPSLPLYAGEYWWNVLSVDPSTATRSYNPPAEFTIPVMLRLDNLAAKRFSSPRRRLWVMVDATTNVKHPLIRVRLLHGRKIVWRVVRRAYTVTGPQAFSFYWYPQRRIDRGTRLRLIVSISAGGERRTHSLVVRAP